MLSVDFPFYCHAVFRYNSLCALHTFCSILSLKQSNLCISAPKEKEKEPKFM